MVTVDPIGRIRRAYFVGKQSIREISRSLKVSRKSVRKALRAPEREFRYTREHQPQPRLGPFVARLEELMAENGAKLTARRAFELLRDDGYAGAYDSVQRHVRQWRLDQSQKIAAFIPLSFAPGEAYQFDWSYDVVVLDGVTVKVKIAHVRLCHSRMLYIRTYPRESQELVLDAHDRAFAFFRGACTRGIYDNMKTAVETVFVGKERKFNRRFLQMCSHYLVEPTACTPAAGWEKGQVENQVGLARDRFFTPRLHFKNYAELNAWLLEQCVAYAKEHPHPELAGQTIWQAFEDERPALVAYRGQFDGFHETQASVSKTCLVRFDTNKYSVMAKAVGRPVAVQAYADRIVIRQNGAIIAVHERQFGHGHTIYDPWHYVPVLAKKPGALRNGEPFKAWMLPGSLERVRQKLKTVSDGDRQMVDIPSAVLTDGLATVDAACAEALEAKLCSSDVILNVLARRRDPAPPLTILTPDALSLRHEPVADCARYDRLLRSSTYGTA